MVFDTFPIEGCTGKALVCLYWISPKIAPTAQIRIPRYISVGPLTPPKLPNFTVSNGGILISASLANAPSAPPKTASRMTARANQFRLVLLIKVRERLCKHLQPCQPYFDNNRPQNERKVNKGREANT